MEIPFELPVPQFGMKVIQTAILDRCQNIGRDVEILGQAFANPQKAMKLSATMSSATFALRT